MECKPDHYNQHFTGQTEFLGNSTFETLIDKDFSHFQLAVNKRLSLNSVSYVRPVLLLGCLANKAYRLSFFAQSQHPKVDYDSFSS
jgi:hypothetical protein